MWRPFRDAFRVCGQCRVEDGKLTENHPTETFTQIALLDLESSIVRPESIDCVAAGGRGWTESKIDLY
jgi:hypothetical protein